MTSRDLPHAYQYYVLAVTGQAAPTPATKASKPAEAASSPAPAAAPTTDGVPRMKLRDLTWANKATFNALMEKHSFIVLTDIGKLKDMYLDLRSEMQAFFEREDAAKDACTSSYIYRNETKTPMWYAGYERSRVRECFRVHTGDMSRLVWPSPAFESTWLAMIQKCQAICDQSLSLTLGYRVQRKDEGDDLSVCYGLHYPNKEGTGQSDGENVFEHVDPSLYVIEPVTDVRGLDVFDQASQRWLCAEDVCVPHEELVLFCGKALARATNDRVPGTLHRVTRYESTMNIPRYCVIYEQKYANFFP